jgi:large subunit ribosomal protein L9
MSSTGREQQMKVILKDNVKNVGKIGDVINVSDGYARNYLFPRKLAVEATEGEVKSLQTVKDREVQKAKKAENIARKAADILKDTDITVKVKVGEGGRMYGSVTNKDVADAISAVTGMEVDKRKIELKESIKTLGSYRAIVRLHHEISAEVRLTVVEG